MYKRIHGNFVHFAPPPIKQVSGKLAHCVRSNSASNLPAMLTKWIKLPTECLLYMEEPFLLYWICHMKIAYWFAPTFFIANNVESHRCALQNKHLFENPWVGAHSVRTENHCLSTQRASLVRSSDNRRRKPTNKGFSPKCASVMCTGGFRTLVNNILISNQNDITARFLWAIRL